MPNAGVKVEIAAEDRITRTLERINKRIEGMRAPALRTQKALSRFSELSGLNKVGTGLNRMGQAAKGAFFSIGRILPVMGVLTSAASVDGVVRLATAWANFGSRLGFSAQRIGVTATQLQTMDGAARLAGSSSGSLQSGVQTLGQGMWDAVGGRAPELVSTFRALHVEFQNTDGSAKSVAEMMPVLMDKVRSIKNPYAQAAVAARLFGSASEDLLPFLRSGSDGFARYTAMAQHYGVTNQAGVVGANRLRMAQTELSLSVEGFGNSLAQSLEPVLTPIIHQMSEWIARNRGWIATKITYYVQEFATWLQSIDWKGVAAGADTVWKRLKAGVDSIGGLKGAAEGFLGLWTAARLAPLLAAVGASGPIGALVLAMGAIALATERTRNAWNDFQERKRLANDDPASDKAKSRLPAFRPASDQTGFHYTGHFWPQHEASPSGKLLKPNQAFSDMIDVASGVNHLDRDQVRALIHAESGGAMVGNSASSAFGYMQLTDSTARDEGVDSHDPAQNLRGGTRHFARALQLAGGNLGAATAAYHDGLNSAGLAWWKTHPGDMSHFSAAGRGEADTVGAYYTAEQQAGAAALVPGRPSPTQDPAGFWNRARGDARTMASAAGLTAAAPPATVPPGTAQGGSLDATIEKLRADLHITVRTPPGTQATVKPGSSSGGMRVASVQTARAMDPEMTPGGY